jgi:hypothetical protein
LLYDNPGQSLAVGLRGATHGKRLVKEVTGGERQDSSKYAPKAEQKDMRPRTLHTQPWGLSPHQDRDRGCKRPGCGGVNYQRKVASDYLGGYEKEQAALRNVHSD